MKFVAALLAVGFAVGGGNAFSGGGHYGHGSVAREQRYAAARVGTGQMGCLIPLWDHESGWNPNAVNPDGGAYGIPQAYPPAQGHPYALGDWRAQIRWGLAYINGRYGSPCAAWAFWQNHNSY